MIRMMMMVVVVVVEGLGKGEDGPVGEIGGGDG